MAPFANPFASAGAGAEADGAFAQQYVVSLTYLTGNPNPQLLGDPQQVQIFKALLKRDPKTREKGATDLLAFFNDPATTAEAISPELHFAWIQLYAKLSIDVSPGVRALAHRALGALFAKLGRHSSKHLKHAIGPWLAGMRDPDQHAAQAAREAFAAVFPEDRQALVIQKLAGAIIEFVADAFGSQSAGTLSDERFVSAEDAALKYARVVKASLDVFNFDILASHELARTEAATALLGDKKLWKLAAVPAPQVSQAALALATNHAALLDAAADDVIWKELLRSLVKGPALVSVDVLRALTVFTKKNSGLWKPTHVAVLAQGVGQKTRRPKTYWPLLYNLVMQLPAPVAITQEATAAALFGALAKSVPPIVGDAEASAWGCVLALMARSEQAAYTQKAMDLVATRAAGPARVGPQLMAALADRYKDLATNAAVRTHAASQLNLLEGTALATYAQILARSGAFASELEAAAAVLPLAAVAALATSMKALKVDTTALLERADGSHESLSELTDVAVALSDRTAAQALVDAIADRPEGPALLLARAKTLARRDLRGDLSEAVDPAEPASLFNAALLHGSLIPEDTATAHLAALAARAAAAESDDDLALLAVLASEDSAFFSATLHRPEHAAALASLEARLDGDDALGLRARLRAADTVTRLRADLTGLGAEPSRLAALVDRATALAAADATAGADLEALLLVGEPWAAGEGLRAPAAAAARYPFRWPASGGPDPAAWAETLALAVYVLNLAVRTGALDRLSSEKADALASSLLLVASAAKGHLWAGTAESAAGTPRGDSAGAELAAAFISEVDEHVPAESRWPALWVLTAAGHPAEVQFHAAQALLPVLAGLPAADTEPLAADARAALLAPPNVRGALLAQLHIGAGAPWYDRRQGELYRTLGTPETMDAAALALIDPAHDPSRLAVAAAGAVAAAPDDALPALLALLTALVESGDARPELAAPAAVRALAADTVVQLLALRVLEPGQHAEVVAEAFLSASARDNSPFAAALAAEFLRHAQWVAQAEQSLALDAAPLYFQLSAPGRLGWAAYAYLRPVVLEAYQRQLLESTLGDTELAAELEEALVENTDSTDRSPAWTLFLESVGVYGRESALIERKFPAPAAIFAKHDVGPILAFVAQEIRELDAEDCRGVAAETLEPARSASVALHLLYLLSRYFGAAVRSWFREITDKALSARVADALREQVVPALMREIGADVRGRRAGGELASVSVAEAAREVRAIMDVDEQEVMIAITLADTHPVRPATVQIKGLSGVPEAKRRAWLLEAEHSVQYGAVVKAMTSLVARFDNFMQGFEPCAICYSIVLEGKHLPTKECSTCHNRYHSDCLYKWISSSGARNCPMCRSPI